MYSSLDVTWATGSLHPMSDRLTHAGIGVLAAGRKCPVRRFAACRERSRAPSSCEDIVSSSSPPELRRSDNQPRQILNKLFQPLGERYTSLHVLPCRRCMDDVNRSLRT